jgi:hypothetical protein
MATIVNGEVLMENGKHTCRPKRAAKYPEKSLSDNNS